LQGECAVIALGTSEECARIAPKSPRLYAECARSGFSSVYVLAPASDILAGVSGWSRRSKSQTTTVPESPCPVRGPGSAGRHD
jgi:hypothetical protein